MDNEKKENIPKKNYYLINKEKIRERNKQKRKEIRAYYKKWYLLNKVELMQRRYERDRKKKNINYILNIEKKQIQDGTIIREKKPREYRKLKDIKDPRDVIIKPELVFRFD